MKCGNKDLSLQFGKLKPGMKYYNMYYVPIYNYQSNAK